MKAPLDERRGSWTLALDAHLLCANVRTVSCPAPPNLRVTAANHVGRNTSYGGQIDLASALLSMHAFRIY
eukprot:1972589-Pleurochrysis_carterae.AAC.1